MHVSAPAKPRRVSNPPNPWSSTEVEWLGEPPPAQLEVFEEDAQSILSRNDSPDVPFTWSLNPYRGCQHACAYCYARPTHQWLGYGAGTDFDTKIVVKRNAPDLLRAAFARRSWRGESVAFSGVTDCYQPLEASYGITRACLEVALEFRNPVGIITKGALVRRDVDLLTKLHRAAGVEVYVSIPFADDDLGRAIEPWAPAPATRFATVRALSEAGLSVGVALAPLIPGLNDSDVPAILSAAHEAGARSAFLVLLRLPAEVEPVFVERLTAVRPGRVAKVLHAVEDLRGGRRNVAEFGRRMVGGGPRWDAIERLFEVTCRRLGLAFRAGAEPRVPRRPRAHTPSMFEDGATPGAAPSTDALQGPE